MKKMTMKRFFDDDEVTSFFSEDITRKDKEEHKMLSRCSKLHSKRLSNLQPCI